MKYNNFILSALYIISLNLAATTRFLVFGDFGTNEENQRIVASDMVQFCHKEGCDFAVTVGDNIYPSGVQNFFEAKVDFDKGIPNYKIITDYFVNTYKSLKIPFYMIFGNNDVNKISLFNVNFTNQDGIYKQLVNLMTNQINYTNNNDNPIVTNSLGQASRMWNFRAAFYHTEEKENINLFAIDTNSFPHEHGDKNFAQSIWLSEELLKPTGWKIVYGHMPLLSHGRHGWKNAEEIKIFKEYIINLLCEARVDFYLSGHDHILELDNYHCSNGHAIASLISGAAAILDRVYIEAFEDLAKDENLIWASGKFYNGNKHIYKNDDEVLGFAHISIDGPKALVQMKLSLNASAERKSACFELRRGKGIKAVSNQSCASL